MNKPNTLTFLAQNTIKDWRRRKRYCCWQWQHEGGKWIKRPFNPATGSYQWKSKAGRTSLDIMLAHYSANPKNVDGIAFVLAQGMGFIVIDLDACRDPETGIIEAWAVDIIGRFRSRTEVSVTGRGVHITILGEKRVGWHKDYYLDGHKIEVIDNAAINLTGHVLEGLPTEPVAAQDILDALIAEADGKEKTVIHRGPFTFPQGVGFQRIGDKEVVARCRTGNSSALFHALFYEGDVSVIKDNDDSVADFALLGELAWWCNGDMKQMERIFKESALYHNPGRAEKWKRPSNGTTYGAWTIESVIRYRIAKGGDDPASMFYQKRLPGTKNVRRAR